MNKKYMNNLSILFIYSIFLIGLVASYTYKKGYSDSAVLNTYVTLAENHVVLDLLENKTAEESRSFYESMLAHNISIHRNLVGEQSIFHGKLDNGQFKPNLEYYEKVRQYVFAHPSNNFSASVIEDINWLVENKDATF